MPCSHLSGRFDESKRIDRLLQGSRLLAARRRHHRSLQHDDFGYISFKSEIVVSHFGGGRPRHASPGQRLHESGQLYGNIVADGAGSGCLLAKTWLSID